MPESIEIDVRPCPQIKLSYRMIGKLNLADYQNAVPALVELAVVNETECLYENLVVSLSSDPHFFRPRHWKIDSVGPGQTRYIPNLDLQLDGPMLARLIEAEFARVRFELSDGGVDGKILNESVSDIELLPRNQWAGLSHPPEMVAAFVQPNDPAIDGLLKNTAQVLRNNSRNPGINGYDSGSKHAWEILSALWIAISGERLDYALPPASFEQCGQKVRNPGQVLSSGIGTCLDLTLLLCAAMEQAGLHPLVVFGTEHAYAGCWLRAEEFSDPFTDDPSAIRKRLLLHEIVLIETTLLAGTEEVSLTRACELGANLIAEGSESQFQGVVDVRRARMRKIRPLATIDARTEEEEPRAYGTTGAAIRVEDPPALPEDLPSAIREPDPRSLAPADRVARWQRKLLDLSLRNSLLNFRKSKRAVKFEVPDPGLLEDTLAAGNALKILEWPELMEGHDPRSRALYEGRAKVDLRRTHALEGLKKGQLFSAAGEADLEGKLVELFRSARASMEEGGANTLFLALGFLVWTQSGREGQRYRAPLILVPVSLARRSVRSGFVLTLHEDESQFNPTLVQMLYQDFQLNLGVAEGDLPKDESGLDVEGIWGRVSEAVKDIRGWEVTPEVVLSTFSFAKHLMWKDLVHRTDDLRANPVVRHLIETPREPYRDGRLFVNPNSLDQDSDPAKTYCPLAADSSQLAAILSAARGKDFVLIGPPGTGKSQTISNLIAHCIASGKRVLFVAEKIAALDVVFRRLKHQGLGQFCLELHSSKAKKTSVIEALASSWNNRGAASKGEWENEAAKLKELRDKLNHYVEQLHRPRSNGMTVHRALGFAIAGREVPYIELRWPDPTDHDTGFMDRLFRNVDLLGVRSSSFGVKELGSTPLRVVGQTEWTPLWQRDFTVALQDARVAADRLLGAYRCVADLAGLPKIVDLTKVERTAIRELANWLPECVGRCWDFTLKADAAGTAQYLQAAASLLHEWRHSTLKLGTPWEAGVTAAAQRGLAFLNEAEQIRAGLPSPWPASILGQLKRGVQLLVLIRTESEKLSGVYEWDRLNARALARDWAEAESAIWPLSALNKRRIAGLLVEASSGRGNVDPTADLPVLCRIEDLRAEVNSLDMRVLPPTVWAGLRTSTDLAIAAIKLQEGLAAVGNGYTWTPSETEYVAAGLCGPELKHVLDLLQRLAFLDGEITALEPLGPYTDGLWAGRRTDKAALSSAIAFCDDWRTGTFRTSHEAVLRGECGKHLKEQFDLLVRRARLLHSINEASILTAKTDGLWRGLDTDLDELARATEFSAMLQRLHSSLDPTVSGREERFCGIRRLFGGLIAEDEVRRSVQVYSEACEQIDATFRLVAQLGDFCSSDYAALDNGSINYLIQQIDGILAAQSRLNRWCAWIEAREEARGLGLIGLYNAVEHGQIDPGKARWTFDVNYSRWWLDHVVTGDSVLRSFVSTEHEKKIADFKALDDNYTKLTSEWIRARLFAETPALESVGLTAEWGQLRHEMTKKKRHLPLRELLGRTGSVITTLTPCLLMSPLSIAQYLAVSSVNFDLVVFDEASQIAVWDAVGAMARAKQVVMVGDPKQLPPTNFFSKADDDSDLTEEIPEDMESILDECIGANLPSVHLSWHYRSRHESLIVFSNRRYYGSNLVTFPSPVTDDRAVSLQSVRGVYEKGGSRTNIEEARAVVRDIVVRLRSEDWRVNGYTIGVVTFNGEQQRLIEDLLDQERRKDPSIETYFHSEREEPIFVKNLESVQGDERDVIYFSITYGPDITGRVSMNFGPMNRDGGERRLNVAITRARRELRVFSSLRFEDIDLSRTQAAGVTELRHFLEFAERGPRAFAEFVSGHSEDFDSPFEAYVATALTSRGWKVHTQVGVSSFRIDLGVVHPEISGRYLAGIECDGQTYHRSATARDRDKLRQSVLEGLGWSILRVWSTDWWLDRDSTLNELDSKLRILLERWEDTRSDASTSGLGSIGTMPPAEMIAGTEHEAIDLDPIDPPTAEPAAAQFFERTYDPVLITMLDSIVAKEGPILDRELARRIARSHGWLRTGRRIIDRVIEVAGSEYASTTEEVGIFFWPRGMVAGSAVEFRSGLDRDVDEICIQELEALARTVSSGGRNGEEAVSAMARTLGLQRLRTSSRPRLVKALERSGALGNV